MKRIFILFAGLVLMLSSCNNPKNMKSTKSISHETIQQTIDSLKLIYGETEFSRIEKGVNQVAGLWRAEDGSGSDFTNFCKESYIISGDKLEALYSSLSRNFEVIWGNMLKMNIELMEPLHMDLGPITPMDEKFGSYNPSAHVTEDLFASKIAFTVALNFPFYTLAEKEQNAANWNDRQWGYARMGDAFTARPPAELLQKSSEVTTIADTYISEYNICMDKLTGNDKINFPEGMRLITHWGLRDELKSNYGTDEGLAKQEMIYLVMKRIVDQSIPTEVINNDKVLWNPETNKITVDGNEIDGTPETARRYSFLLENFKAVKALDVYYPNYPTFIQRKFDGEMEISQQEVEALFVSLVSSPLVKEVGSIIAKRLGRDLRPYDIWYDGFKARSGISQDLLNQTTEKLYPNAEAFEKALPGILEKFGFETMTANAICSKIRVDGSRGAGHAWGAAMKSEKARLRTRIPASGMNYKGYNIAVHEFGHNVEQTITLQNVSDYMINGVPNTAFTEALAFVFQKRDLELLGMKENNPQKEYLQVLDNFWSVYEIMGVSLVDMKVWKWMYENPETTPEMLRDNVIRIAKEVWNEYYAPVFGMKDEPILAIYSHMIDNPLYLSAYPLGHLIEFQLEGQLKGKSFAAEIQRIYRQGRVVPQVWMQKAVGEKLSVNPLINATEEAIKQFN
ncbi:MAG: lipoprotein [Bacteroidales bacterium]|nr:lipoprotein [Bacteroidales bacterium]